MLDFFNKLLFGRENSSATAKERLKLVLLSDHISLSPEVIDRLKADLLEVISRYVEIDQSHADVTFEHREREIAMLANVPILGLRDGRGGPGSRAEAASAPPPNVAPLRPAHDAFVAAPSHVAVDSSVAERGDEDFAREDLAADHHPTEDRAAETFAAETFATDDARAHVGDSADRVAASDETESAPELFEATVKPNAAPKRSANSGQRRRRRRKPTAPKKAPGTPPGMGNLGGVPRPAQA